MTAHRTGEQGLVFRDLLAGLDESIDPNAVFPWFHRNLTKNDAVELLVRGKKLIKNSEVFLLPQELRHKKVTKNRTVSIVEYNMNFLVIFCGSTTIHLTLQLKKNHQYETSSYAQGAYSPSEGNTYCPISSLPLFSIVFFASPNKRHWVVENKSGML